MYSLWLDLFFDTEVKVIFQVQDQIHVSRSHFSKHGCYGVLVFHKQSMFIKFIFPFIEQTITKQWVLEWQLSTYSKSYFLKKGLDPYKRTKKGFRYIKRLKVTEEDMSEEMDDIDEDFYHNNTDTGSNDNADDGQVGDATKDSRITALTLYNNDIVVYDQGKNVISHDHDCYIV